MNVVSHCVWCKARFASTVPELCDDLRVAIEEGDEHNALIMAFAAELALFQESWPYCSRRCENEDIDYPEMHPDREGLETTLRSIDSLPWNYIQAKAQGLEIPQRPPPPKLVGLGPDDVLEESDGDVEPVPQAPPGPNLRLVEKLKVAESEAQDLVKRRRRRVDASFRASQKKSEPLKTATRFTAGFFLGALAMHFVGLTQGDDALTLAGSTLMIGTLLGIIAALLALKQSK